MTKIEIIDETVNYYRNNSRSIDNGRCKYNGANGEKCAFSRCCTDDSVFEENKASFDQTKAILLPQYSHIPFDDYFWEEIQSLHDLNSNWNGKELSKMGVSFVQKLKNKYK